MTVKELKKIIAEEYKYWMAEQPADMPDLPGMPGGMPGGAGDAPSVDVGPDDIDAGTGEDSEDTLRQIFNMLKDYFEGDKEDDAPKDDAKGGAKGGAPKKDDDKDDDKEDDKEDDKKDDDKEALQERFKKLANIIKG